MLKKSLSFIRTVIVTAPVLIFAACGNGLGEIREFQYYSGNESLPPPYQRVLIVRGVVNPPGVTVLYSNREGENKTEETFELTGEEYEKCVGMLANTSLRDAGNPAAGASVVDVTLKDVNGKKATGKASNADEWREFIAGIRQKAARR